MHKAQVNGDMIRKLRSDKLITQQDLAGRAGIAVETLCRLELGRRPANFQTIHKIADALEVPATDLVIKESQ